MSLLVRMSKFNQPLYTGVRSISQKSVDQKAADEAGKQFVKLISNMAIFGAGVGAARGYSQRYKEDGSSTGDKVVYAITGIGLGALKGGIIGAGAIPIGVPAFTVAAIFWALGK